jgi:hypothetical protein
MVRIKLAGILLCLFVGSRVQGFKGSRVQGFKGSRVQGNDFNSKLRIVGIQKC